MTELEMPEATGGERPIRMRTAIGARLLALGLVTSPVIWVAAMWSSRLEIGPYGIATTLSPLWYVSALLAFAGMAGAVAMRQLAYAGGFGILLSMFVALPSFILEKTPRFPYIFDSYAYADS